MRLTVAQIVAIAELVDGFPEKLDVHIHERTGTSPSEVRISVSSNGAVYAYNITSTGKVLNA